MRIAIMGTGGVGGYYGALLALTGKHDVAFIARGPHLEAIRGRGLEVKSVLGDLMVSPARATDRPAEIGPVDLVLFTTKTYHTDEAALLIKPIVNESTTVISFQNGVDAAERIGDVVGRERILGGVTWLSAAVEAPGVIGQYSQFRRIVLGELDGQRTKRLENIADALQHAGPTVEVTDSISKVLWTKFVFISSVSAVGSLARVTFGEYRDVPEARSVLKDAIGEVVAVARAGGVVLDEDVVEKTLEFLDSSAPGIKPSMQRDVEAGKVNELESMVGVVVKKGQELGVPTPFMRVAYGMLKPCLLNAMQSKA